MQIISPSFFSFLCEDGSNPTWPAHTVKQALVPSFLRSSNNFGEENKSSKYTWWFLFKNGLINSITTLLPRPFAKTQQDCLPRQTSRVTTKPFEASAVIHMLISHFVGFPGITWQKETPSFKTPWIYMLNTEWTCITRLMCSACQSEIPMDTQSSQLIGLFTQV